MVKFRIKKVNSNYGKGLRFESNNPYDMYIVQKYNGWFWGWSTIRSAMYSYHTFESYSEAYKFMKKLENQNNY